MRHDNPESNRADAYAALSSPVRRQVLSLLRERAMSAGEIADQVAVSKPTLSGHLKVLKAADLVTVERKGATLLYRINLSVAEEALAGLIELFQLGSESGKRLMRSFDISARGGPS